MPIKQMPSFKSTPDKMFEIPQPGIGGINLKDLEFEQDVNQSPYMRNMMYRNGAFSKRYGQEVTHTFLTDIVASIYFDGYIYAHVASPSGADPDNQGTIYKYKPSTDEVTQVSTGFSSTPGLFMIYAQELYYLRSGGIYKLSSGSFSRITPYVPDFMINCKPDGSDGGDVVDELNIIGGKFNMLFNGEDNVKDYYIANYDTENIIDWDGTITAKEDGNSKIISSIDKENKIIHFQYNTHAGDLNVVITFPIKDSVFSAQRAQIYSCTCYDTFGGASNTRLFLAGCGRSKYFYSNAYDITYFPENNFATLGNTEDDITGFGRQYNVLIVFKPKEIYSIYSYTENASTTIIEENYGLEGFKSQLVNPRIGCDAPKSIQLINNLLTWFNSNEGVCTLVSTNVQDERNVRRLSRNIDRTNSFGIQGILDINQNPKNVISADFENKYFLCFPSFGICYVWDYEISPYSFTSNGETNPSKLTWFYFNNVFAGEFIRVEKELFFYGWANPDVTERADHAKRFLKFNDSFVDVYRTGENPIIRTISSFYMTPFMQFGSVEMLKNIKNIYVQCRGDTATVIDMYYYTDDNSSYTGEIGESLDDDESIVNGEREPESIRIGGRIWKNFQFKEWQWLTVGWATVFRRKCNLKKIQMASFYFQSKERYRDMSITHVGMQYQLVKYVR